MSFFDPDIPSDGTYSKPDCLHREEFAIALAKNIIPSTDDPCLVVSIEGQWGEGKTTFFNMLKFKLGNVCPGAIIINFNPWLVSDAESLVQKFLVQFAVQITSGVKKQDDELAIKLLKYSEIFNALKMLPGTEPWASIATGIFKGSGKVSQAFQKAKQLNIEGRKGEVAEAVKKLGHPIFVFIDDIDRLAPKEAFEVIRLVKAVANFPQTVFLLAFDQDYLVRVFEEQKIPKPLQYLEKIIQVRVPLPQTCTDDIQVLVNRELSELIESDKSFAFEGDQERFRQIYWRCCQFLINTPRDLKRIFNHLRLSLLHVDGEVCFSDLFALSVLAIKAPEIYDLLKIKPEIFVGRRYIEINCFGNAEEMAEKLKEELSVDINKLPTENREPIAALLGMMFPTSGDNKPICPVSEWDKAGRIASADRLYIAMHYRTRSGVFSEYQIRCLLEGGTKRIEMLADVMNASDDAVQRSFALVSYNIKSLKLGQAQLFLDDLYNAVIPSNRMKETMYGPFPFMGGLFLHDVLRWLTFDVINEAQEKYQLIKNLFGNENYLLLTGDVLIRLAVQHDDIKFNDDGAKKILWIENVNQYRELKNIWLSTCGNAISSKRIFAQPYAAWIFTVYKQVDYIPASQILSVLLINNELENIARLIAYNGTNSANGPYCKFNTDDWKKSIPVDQLKGKVKKAIDERHESEYTTMVNAVFQSILDEKKHYWNGATRD